MPGPTVALVGSLDTKAEEYGYIRERLVRHGCAVLILDSGVLDGPGLTADFDREEVAVRGGAAVSELRRQMDRTNAMRTMATGAAQLLADLHARGQLNAVMAVGGSNAAYVMSVACADLPLGLPKMLVSTMAAGDTRPYVGQTDLTLMNPVVDINGLNRLTRQVLDNAAAACAGMALNATRPPDQHVPATAAISMFGVTTTCGAALRRHLTRSGIESLTFHATGVGGRTLESLVSAGRIQAVADMTTTELADELVGGVCTAGPHRLTAASRAGVPQVVSLGALDMVNFGSRASVPAQFTDRLLHEHNPEVTLMRTSVEECAELGRLLAAKLNAAIGPCAVLIPTGGFSQISVPGQPFYDPKADHALINTLTAELSNSVETYRFDTHINDPIVAERAANLIIRWLEDRTHD